MKTSERNLTIVLSRWKRLPPPPRGFLGVPFSSGPTAALLFVVLMGGCKKETSGIVNNCITPTVIRTSSANRETNVPLNKTSLATVGTSVAAVKIITATFKTTLN